MPLSSSSTNDEMSEARNQTKNQLSIHCAADESSAVGRVVISLNKSSSMSSIVTNTAAGSTTIKSSKSIDQHPYARGSVIEVLRGENKTPYLCDVIDRQPMDTSWSNNEKDLDEDSYTSTEDDTESALLQLLNEQHEDITMLPNSSSFIDSDMSEGETNTTNNSFKKSTKPKKTKHNNNSLANNNSNNNNNNNTHKPQRWRYYIHYRDSNRRLDEWVTVDRIVSPPSVGAAMIKAIAAQQKKKEEDERKKIQDEEVAESTISDEPPAIRMTRRQKRKSVGDDGTTHPSTNTSSSTSTTVGGPSSSTLPAGIRILTPGGGAANVVATIPAEELDEHAGLDESALREHEEVTKVKNVGEVELGKYRMSTWYFSPLPKEIMKNGFVDVLYICEFTFHFFVRKEELLRFQAKSGWTRRYPLGNEIYRSGNLSMFEVDGSEQRIYCQNLCYLAKLFLDHKTLYYDVDPFLFYVLCEVDNRGFHPVGYFSKEKYSDAGFNLACILTFPCYQRKGYGRFLISFSYELSKREEKVGSPEKPMSDLGQQAYKPYWNSVIADFLLQQSKIENGNRLSIMDIAKKTSIMAEDIIFTLNQLGILKVINGVYFISAEEQILEELVKKHPIKEPIVDPNKLHWTPFLTDIKRDKFSIHSKRPSIEEDETRVANVQ